MAQRRRPARPLPARAAASPPSNGVASAWPIHPRSRARRALNVFLGVVFALALCGAAFIQWRGTAGRAATVTNVLACRGFPHFTKQYGFVGGVTVSTTDRERVGLVLLDPQQPGKGFQHPNGTWDDAGYLGPFAVDADGNVYVAPVPRTDLLRNPLAGATTIWRLDSERGDLRPFVTIDAAAAPSERNPFGVLGLAYDCTTNSLYASSVAGSSPSAERGRIVRIDLATRTMSTILDRVDVLGLAVAQTPDGKRLYYGPARTGELWSMGLDGSGDKGGDPRLEVDQAALGTTNEEKVRRIAVERGQMTVAVVPFAFTLQARSDTLQRPIVLRYDAAKGAWQPQ